jgi:hypothetical protein
MPRSSPSSDSPAVAANSTVKLPASLRERVAKAMQAEGFTVWSEFCRVALTEKCAAIEVKAQLQDIELPQPRTSA